mgnify:CR=1 FL=1
MRKYLPYVPGILTRLCYVLLKKWKEINKKALILFLSLLFLWIFMVPMGLVGVALLHTIKDWKDGKGFVLPWAEQEEQREIKSPQQQDISYQLDSNSVQSVLWYYLHPIRGN